MTETEILVSEIVEALQDKKGRDIITMNLTEIQGSVCQYFVICEGGSPTQVSALSDSVWVKIYERLKEKPLGIVGTQEAQWIALDYGTVIVHVFLPELRQYYNLENLWEDAKIQEFNQE